MPQPPKLSNSFVSSPFLVTFLQAALAGLPREAAVEFVRTLYEIALKPPHVIGGISRAVLLLDESVPESCPSLTTFVEALRSRCDNASAVLPRYRTIRQSSHNQPEIAYRKVLSDILRIAVSSQAPLEVPQPPKLSNSFVSSPFLVTFLQAALAGLPREAAVEFGAHVRGIRHARDDLGYNLCD